MNMWDDLREAFGYTQDPRDEKGFELLHQLEKEIIVASFMGESSKSITKRLKVSADLLRHVRRSVIFTFNKARRGYHDLIILLNATIQIPYDHEIDRHCLTKKKVIS